MTSGNCGCARRRDVAAEALGLRLARAVVVEVVEPGLADGHHLGMRRQPHDLLDRDIQLLVGIVRVRADRAEDVVVAPRRSRAGWRSA